VTQRPRGKGRINAAGNPELTIQDWVLTIDAATDQLRILRLGGRVRLVAFHPASNTANIVIAVEQDTP
jgi:hypothetical protein